MVGSFNSIDSDDMLNIIINGKELVINFDHRGIIEIIKNETEFYINTSVVKETNEWVKGGRLEGQRNFGSNSGFLSSLARITLKGYFTPETNISILGKVNGSFNDEAYGYIQNSLEVEKVEDFKIPTPYTNIATKVDGVANHTVDIKKEVTDGITFGGIFSFSPLNDGGVILDVSNGKSKPYISFFRNGKTLSISINGNYTNTNIPFPLPNKGFYAFMSINLKSDTITVQIDDKKYSMNGIGISADSKFTDISYGDYFRNSPTNFITNMWYWIGDTVDIKN